MNVSSGVGPLSDEDNTTICEKDFESQMHTSHDFTSQFGEDLVITNCPHEKTHLPRNRSPSSYGVNQNDMSLDDIVHISLLAPGSVNWDIDVSLVKQDSDADANFMDRIRSFFGREQDSMLEGNSDSLSAVGISPIQQATEEQEGEAQVPGLKDLVKMSGAQQCSTVMMRVEPAPPTPFRQLAADQYPSSVWQKVSNFEEVSPLLLFSTASTCNIFCDDYIHCDYTSTIF